MHAHSTGARRTSCMGWGVGVLVRVDIRGQMQRVNRARQEHAQREHCAGPCQLHLQVQAPNSSYKRSQSKVTSVHPVTPLLMTPRVCVHAQGLYGVQVFTAKFGLKLRSWRCAGSEEADAGSYS